MASVSPCPVLGYGAEGSAEVRAEDVVLDNDLRPRFRLSTPWGAGDVRLAVTGSSRFPTPSQPRPRHCGAACPSKRWCPPWRGHRVALSHGGAPRSRWTRPGRGLLQRQPGLDRGGAAFDGALRAARSWRCSGSWPSGAETEAEHRRIARLAEGLGIEVVGYQTGLYGAAQVTGADEAVALLRGGPGRRGPGERQPGGALEDVVRRYGAATGVQSLVTGA